MTVRVPTVVLAICGRYLYNRVSYRDRGFPTGFWHVASTNYKEYSKSDDEEGKRRWYPEGENPDEQGKGGGNN